MVALAGDAARGVRLFPVASAYRLNAPAFTGTPMPKDEPLAPNPPLGAVIDYALPPSFAGPVQIAIFDGSGAALRKIEVVLEFAELRFD